MLWVARELAHSIGLFGIVSVVTTVGYASLASVSMSKSDEPFEFGGVVAVVVAVGFLVTRIVGGVLRRPRGANLFYGVLLVLASGYLIYVGMDASRGFPVARAIGGCVLLFGLLALPLSNLMRHWVVLSVFIVLGLAYIVGVSGVWRAVLLV